MSTTEHSVEKIWHALGNLLPLLGATMLIASVAYDFSFLYALGLSLDDIPSTLSEHVRSALGWAPKIAIAFALYAIVELYLRRAEGGLTEVEIIEASPMPRFTKVFRRSGDRALWIGAILAALIGPFLSTDGGWVFLTFMVLWGTIAVSVLAHPRLSANFGTMRKRLLLISPVLLSMVCIQGSGAGNSLKNALSPRWEISLKDGDTKSTLQLLGMRRFSTFAIGVTAERRILIIPNEAILSTSTMQPLDVKTLNACRWLNVACPTPSHK
jgi:hypothetical protein